MKIWHRFFLRSFTSCFTFYLMAAFFVYLLIDLSINGMSFFSDGSGFKEMLFYYLKNLSIHWDLFAAFAFILACLKVISSSIFHLEWNALQMGGLSSRQLLTPFFLGSLVLAAASLCNSQWGLPIFAEPPVQQIYTLQLKDGSELVYKDRNETGFIDLFWIRNKKEIWHLDRLALPLMIGQNVDILERREGIRLQNHADELICSDILLFDDWEKEAALAPESSSITSLLRGSFANPAKSKTYLHRKLALPFLPLIAILGLAPSLLRFQRRSQLFLITALSLLFFLTYFTLFEGLQILSENRVFSPWAATWCPLCAIVAFFIARFRKLY